jgi:hypothetical protein
MEDAMILADTVISISWKDIITIGAASVGAVLGVMNTINAMSQQRMRVRVTPAFITTPQSEPLGFSIEVINLSAFPVTVAEVGFTVGGNRRVPVQSPRFLNGETFPCRLQPREAVSAMFGPTNFPIMRGLTISDAYARTACGRTIYGNSPAGRQFATILTEIAEGR